MRGLPTHVKLQRASRTYPSPIRIISTSALHLRGYCDESIKIMSDKYTFLDQIKWTSEGLVPAIAQDHHSGVVLMMAWMNRESLCQSVAKGRAIYWSRSRGQLWAKGERSGNIQFIKDILLDCDGDTVVLCVEQQGGIACHTGRESCFYRTLQNGVWETNAEVIRDPEQMYKRET